MSCTTIHPLLTQLALGTIDAADGDAAHAHLARCPACRLELQELSDAVAALEVDATPDVALEPTESDRASLLAAARRTPRSTATAPTRSRSPRRRWRSPSWLAAGAASLACLALAAVLVDSRQRVDSLERRLADARGDQVAVLRGASIDDLDVAGPFGDARAQVVIQKDAGVVAFRDVPAPPDELVWQIWTIDEDSTIRSLGVIEDARRAAFLPIDDVDPEDIERIIVTTEPLGGSDEPTADEVAHVTV